MHGRALINNEAVAIGHGAPLVPRGCGLLATIANRIFLKSLAIAICAFASTNVKLFC